MPPKYYKNGQKCHENINKRLRRKTITPLHNYFVIFNGYYGLNQFFRLGKQF